MPPDDPRGEARRDNTSVARPSTLDAKVSPPAPSLSLRTYRGPYGRHSHGFAQVLAGVRGSLELEVDGRGGFVDVACGLVIPAGAAHGYLAKAPAEVLVLDCPSGPGTDRFRRFALPTGWRERAAALSADELLEGLASAPALQRRRRLDLDALTRAVDAALHRRWTEVDLARACHFSAPRFRARFVELTGLAPLAWLRQRRLDEAQRLLRAGLPLETVALNVGYASASALCYALRRDRGLGARELRRLPS